MIIASVFTLCTVYRQGTPMQAVPVHDKKKPIAECIHLVHAIFTA